MLFSSYGNFSLHETISINFKLWKFFSSKTCKMALMHFHSFLISLCNIYIKNLKLYYNIYKMKEFNSPPKILLIKQKWIIENIKSWLLDQTAVKESTMLIPGLRERTISAPEVLPPPHHIPGLRERTISAPEALPPPLYIPGLRERTISAPVNAKT